MDLAAPHREIDAVQDLFATGRGVQITDFEDVLGGHGSTTATVPPSSLTS